MKNIIKVISCLVIVLCMALSFPTFSSAKWWRGQVHIHTNLTEPANAVSWYKYHGYNFAIISDLNYATPVEGLNSVYGAPGRFLVIPGIELNIEVPHSGGIGSMTPWATEEIPEISLSSGTQQLTGLNCHTSRPPILTIAKDG